MQSSEAMTDRELRAAVKDWLGENWTSARADEIRRSQSVWGASTALQDWMAEVVAAR